MYAAPFQYLRAESWGDAVTRLDAAGDDAMVIAGGQSLAPMMMLRMAEPAVLVDVGGADDRSIFDDDGGLVLSALVRHVDILRSSTVSRRCPILVEAVRHIGNVRVRSRGTIGGSLANAEPSAELPCVAVALGARVRALGPDGERLIPASELFVSHFENSLRAGEVITHVEIPRSAPRQGAAFVEWARRPGDYATVEVAAVIVLTEEGRCASVRTIVGAIDERPVDVSDAIGSIEGVRPGDAWIAEASRAAAATVTISDSPHGSIEYRRDLVNVIIQRALHAAAARATEAAE